MRRRYKANPGWSRWLHLVLATHRIANNPWHVIRSVLSRRGPVPDWIAEINAIVAQLEGVNRSSEADFLAITDRLTSFLSAARKIAAESRAIAEAVSGETGAGLCNALQSVLDDAGRIEKQAEVAQQLQKVRGAVREIRQSLNGFGRVGPSFQVMATLVQIETAHLGSAGVDLGHLGEEFRAAGEGIRSRVESILEGVEALESRIESASREASEFDRQSRSALPALIAAAGQGLSDFRTRRSAAGATLQGLARQSDEVAKAIGELVASLQFHDITRQKVEHIIDSLKHLSASPAANGPRRPPPPAVVDLQIAQLENARAVFLDAIRQVDRQLAIIVGRTREMGSAGGSLLEASDSGESSFYVQMENCFRAIVEAAGKCLALDGRTRSAMLGLREIVQMLEGSLRDIHSVELRLNWLAINAGISACHIGAAGEPLEAVAGAMHQLVAECEISSGEADQTIGRMADAVRLAIEEERSEAPAAGGASFELVRGRIQELRDLDEQSRGRLGEIASTGSNLSVEIDAARQHIAAGQAFTATTQECCESLRGIRPQASGERQGGADDALLQYQQHYTMSSERDIHDAIAGSVGPPHPGSDQGAMESEELAGSVELF